MSLPKPAAPDLHVKRWTAGKWSESPDAVVMEEPLQLLLDGEPLSVVMRTPGNDIELTMGLLYAEGVIQSAKDVKAVRISAEAGERLGGAGGEHVAGVGEAAAAAGALDQPLPGGGLEQTQVLARAGLADANRGRRGRDTSLPLYFDQEAHPGGVPELPQSTRRGHIRYR